MIRRLFFFPDVALAIRGMRFYISVRRFALCGLGWRELVNDTDDTTPHGTQLQADPTNPRLRERHEAVWHAWVRLDDALTAELRA